MKKQFTEAQLAEISALQEKHNITRKSAIRGFEKSGKKIVLTAPVKPVARAVDVKSRAANDDTNRPVVPVAASPSPAKPATKSTTPKPAVPQTAAGAARGVGIRLFKLSNVAALAKDEGTTTKALFKHVYGERGHLMTWEQRAKYVGLATAEEAAREFARMRGGKAQEFVKAEAKESK